MPDSFDVRGQELEDLSKQKSKEAQCFTFAVTSQCYTLDMTSQCFTFNAMPEYSDVRGQELEDLSKKESKEADRPHAISSQ